MAKIKNQIPRGLVKRSQRIVPYHYWLQEEPPRKRSRLGQLNKRNTRLRISRGIPAHPEAATALKRR